MKKRLLATLLAFCFLFFNIKNIKIYANGDVNIENGGGGNIGDATDKGTNILGNEQDEGVRVTLIDAKTYQQMTRPIDFANNPRGEVKRYFGAVNKLEYKNGEELKPIMANDDNKYVFKKPDFKLPKIVGGSLQNIKNCFGDENFLKNFQI